MPYAVMLSLLLRSPRYDEYKLQSSFFHCFFTGAMERAREGKKVKERPNFFFCLLYLYFFLISVFIYLIFSVAFVCLCVLSLLMPFSHSAYIEIRLKEFDQILFFYLCFDALAVTTNRKKKREELDVKTEKSE